MMVPAPEPDLHHGVLERINAGFCVIQVLFEGDRAVDYRFIEVNDAFERHTGLKDARGQRMSALEPNHEEDWFRIYGEVARSGRPAQFEMEARALGRSFAVDAVRVGRPGEDKVGILFFDITARPRFSRMGRFIGLAGSSPDVTERREIELAREELLQSERAARSAAENMARLKDEFLATLSHELRTPLTTILGWSELLLQRVDNTSPLYKGLNVIANSAGAQKRLISDMLDLSSMLLGKVQLEVEVLDLRTLLGEAIGAQELVAEGKALDVHLQLPEQPSLVLGDATRLQQVFWNLLSNAIKFTPAEGRIDVQLQADGTHWVITVRDTGDGIAPEFLNHLFSRFRQADGTTTRRHGGLGLGLAIVQQLVELHGGTVAAASEGHGHGATFTVRLPQHLPDAERRPLREVISGPILEPVIVEPYPLRGMHVLAVEDQPEVLEYLRRMLEEQGASVSAASSAGEALALLADTGHLQYHVMLTDIGMPGMDGYGLVRTLREDMGVDAATLPAVAVTALARADDRRRALASGFQEHVAKPYSVAQLVAAVRKVQVPRADSALH
ncbi:TPA: ATP-binding protein [Stenotrophomonas maltophilia]